MTPRIFTKRSLPLALIVICSMWNKSTLSYSCNDGKFTLIFIPMLTSIRRSSCYILGYLLWVQTQRDSLLPWPSFFVKILCYIYIYLFFILVTDWVIFKSCHQTITFTNIKRVFFWSKRSHIVPQGIQSSSERLKGHVAIALLASRN